MAEAAVIIPARYESTRFPGKPLHPIAGKPLIRHVWERCMRARKVGKVIVATDDMRIAECAFGFGAEVAVTSRRHPTGTDRIAEVAAKLKRSSVIVNVQGDEPLVAPGLIDRLVESFDGRPKRVMATAAAPFANAAEAADPNRVKVVLGGEGRALYFSRSPIPFRRDAKNARPPFLHHMGIYAYRRSFLLEFVKWKPTPLERAEALEQLRALEHGAEIHVVVARSATLGVDAPEDVAIVERLMAGG